MRIMGKFLGSAGTWKELIISKVFNLAYNARSQECSKLPAVIYITGYVATYNYKILKFPW